MDTAAALDVCTCNTLRRAARLASQFYDARLAASGVRVSQLSVLMTLKASGGASVNELAAQLGLDRTTTGKNLRPLQRAGLVAVVRSARDGRSREVALTPKGADKLAEDLELWGVAQAEFERANGREAMEELRARLKVLSA